MHYQSLIRSTATVRFIRYPGCIPATWRSLATGSTPPPPSSGEPKKHNDALLFGAGAAVLAGIYYYYTRERQGHDRPLSTSERASREEEEIRQKMREAQDDARQAAEAARARADDAVRQTQEKYGGMKASAKTRAEESGHELTGRARQNIQAAQSKVNEYKEAAEKSFEDARKASERRYEEAKDTAAQKAEEAKDSGWKLFGFGSQKAEETKKQTTEKVAGTAEDVKRKAEK
ncbi:hypothetical protein EDC04DRAFT_324770 [Pisolithus marmoratus]|nr:hypothetical protein EDC04DRAFT_324770 [Pisolithus marmoratus]